MEVPPIRRRSGMQQTAREWARERRALARLLMIQNYE
jgi:hypothetical protein